MAKKKKSPTDDVLAVNKKIAKIYDFKLPPTVLSRIRKEWERKSPEEIEVELGCLAEDLAIAQSADRNRIRCLATTTAGTQCTKQAMAGDFVCKIHSDNDEWATLTRKAEKLDYCLATTRRGRVCKNLAPCEVHEDEAKQPLPQMKEEEDMEQLVPEPVIEEKPMDPKKEEKKVETVEKPDLSIKRFFGMSKAALLKMFEDQQWVVVPATGSRSLKAAPEEIRRHAWGWSKHIMGLLQQIFGDRLLGMSGMSEGMDELHALVCNHLDIRWVAAIPTRDYGSYYWGEQSVTGKIRVEEFVELRETAYRVRHIREDVLGIQPWRHGPFYARMVDGKWVACRKGDAGATHFNFLRNAYMVEHGNLFLVYNRSSSGTNHCVGLIQKAGKPFVEVDKI